MLFGEVSGVASVIRIRPTPASRRQQIIRSRNPRCRFAEIAANTKNVYVNNAARYDKERVKTLIEREWLKRFEKLLPKKARILDVGCGAGEPIARYFIDSGHAITGVDYAMPMLNLAQARFPEGAWILADMRKLHLKIQYDGIIGWHSFFHLNPREQRRGLAILSRHLKPGGVLMITVGPEAREVVGRVGGEEVYHASLSPIEYRMILDGLNIEIADFVLEDPDCDHATVILARKRYFKGER